MSDSELSPVYVRLATQNGVFQCEITARANVPRNIWINIDQDIFLRKDVLFCFCPLDLLLSTLCKTSTQTMHGPSSKATQLSNMVTAKFSP